VPIEARPRGLSGVAAAPSGARHGHGASARADPAWSRLPLPASDRPGPPLEREPPAGSASVLPAGTSLPGAWPADAASAELFRWLRPPAPTRVSGRIERWLRRSCGSVSWGPRPPVMCGATATPSPRVSRRPASGRRPGVQRPRAALRGRTVAAVPDPTGGSGPFAFQSPAGTIAGCPLTPNRARGSRRTAPRATSRTGGPRWFGSWFASAGRRPRRTWPPKPRRLTSCTAPCGDCQSLRCPDQSNRRGGAGDLSR